MKYLDAQILFWLAVLAAAVVYGVSSGAFDNAWRLFFG